MKLALLFAAALLLALSNSHTVSAQLSGCGLKPLKPLVPLGCADLVAQCVCDQKGKSCRWTWVCVPKKSK